MKLNPTLYKIVDQSRENQNNFTDPFQKIMQQQDMWIKDASYIKSSIYRTDLDHPNSQHNITTGQSASMQVQIPKTQAPSAGKVTLNGYYDKESMSLKNGFQEHTVKGISPMDNRFINQKENFNFQKKNKLYQLN